MSPAPSTRLTVPARPGGLVPQVQQQSGLGSPGTWLVMDGFDYYGKYADLAGWLGGTALTNGNGRIDGSAIDVIFLNDIYRPGAPDVVGFAFQNRTESRLWGPGGSIFKVIQGFYSCADPSKVCKNPNTPYIFDDQIGLGLDGANKLFAWTSEWQSQQCVDGHSDHCQAYVPVTVTYGLHETPSIPFFTWNYLEFNMITFEVFLNGELIIDSSSTQAGPSGEPGVAPTSGLYADRYYLQEPALDGVMGYDDFYASSGINATYGDMHIATKTAVADGAHTDWHPHGANGVTTHYTQVDKTTWSPTAPVTYNWSATPGAKDTYQMAPLTNPGATILACQLDMALLNTHTPPDSVKPIIRQGGTDYLGPQTFMGVTSYGFASFLSTTDPTGSAWTVTTVNADEYGIELYT